MDITILPYKGSSFTVLPSTYLYGYIDVSFFYGDIFTNVQFGCITEARKNPTDFLQSAVINEHTEDNHHAEPYPSNQKKTTNGNTLKDFESKRGSHLFYHGDDATLVKDN